MSPSVFIADDVAPLRALIRAMLEQDGDIVVVGEAGNGIDALAGVAELRPDVLLLDLSMPSMDGLEVLAALDGLAAHTEVIVFSGLETGHVAHRRALELGASAYVSKGTPFELLRDAIRQLARR